MKVSKSILKSMTKVFQFTKLKCLWLLHFIRLIFKISFNLMLTAVKMWKSKQSSQSQSSSVNKCVGQGFFPLQSNGQSGRKLTPSQREQPLQSKGGFHSLLTPLGRWLDENEVV